MTYSTTPEPPFTETSTFEPPTIKTTTVHPMTHSTSEPPFFTETSTFKLSTTENPPSTTHHHIKSTTEYTPTEITGFTEDYSSTSDSTDYPSTTTGALEMNFAGKNERTNMGIPVESNEVEGK
jgi:hypothetical protein